MKAPPRPAPAPFIAALAALAVVAALLAGPASGAAGPSPEEIEAALGKTVRARHLQTEIPQPVQAPPAPASWSLPPEAARALLWFAAASAAAALAWALLNVGWGRGSRAREPEPGDEPAPASASVGARLVKVSESADELARQGRFGPAMHILLLNSVEEMRRRLSTPIAASLTSREILARAGLTPTAGAALADIVGRVEISYFGGHVPGAEEYAACRRSFEKLAGWLRSRAAA